MLAGDTDPTPRPTETEEEKMPSGDTTTAQEEPLLGDEGVELREVTLDIPTARILSKEGWPQVSHILHDVCIYRIYCNFYFTALQFCFLFMLLSFDDCFSLLSSGR